LQKKERQQREEWQATAVRLKLGLQFLERLVFDVHKRLAHGMSRESEDDQPSKGTLSWCQAALNLLCHPLSSTGLAMLHQKCHHGSGEISSMSACKELIEAGSN
jgi:hypothetical protein